MKLNHFTFNICQKFYFIFVFRFPSVVTNLVGGLFGIIGTTWSWKRKLICTQVAVTVNLHFHQCNYGQNLVLDYILFLGLCLNRLNCLSCWVKALKFADTINQFQGRWQKVLKLSTYKFFVISYQKDCLLACPSWTRC